MTEHDTLVLIPARMAASRLPGKPLLDIAGLPMIAHVLRRAQEAQLGRVAVATDSAEIAAAVTAQGGEAVMTRADHPSGSDRIFEALDKLDGAGRIQTIINVQGDLPTIAPADIRAVLQPFSDSSVDIATLAAEIRVVELGIGRVRELFNVYFGVAHRVANSLSSFGDIFAYVNFFDNPGPFFYYGLFGIFLHLDHLILLRFEIGARHRAVHRPPVYIDSLIT